MNRRERIEAAAMADDFRGVHRDLWLELRALWAVVDAVADCHGTRHDPDYCALCIAVSAYHEGER